MTDPVIEAFYRGNPDWKQRIEILSVRPYLTKEQTATIFKSAAGADAATNFIISAFIDLGLRANEIINLKMSDIDLKNQAITIKPDGAARTIEFGREFASAARPLLDKAASADSHLLTTSRGNKFSVNSFANKIKLFLKDIDPSRTTSNGTALRRTFLVNRILQGAIIEHLAVQNGYETVKYILDFVFEYIILDKGKIYSRLA